MNFFLAVRVTLALLVTGHTLRSASGPLAIGHHWQILLDQSLVASSSGLQLVQHAPVSGGVVLRAERPWEGNVLYMSSVTYLDGHYRMIYRAGGALCLALSRDGVAWDRPSLGLIEHGGSKENNIIADDRGQSIGMGLSFLDPRPDTPHDERIKILIWRDDKRYYHYPLDNQAGARPLSTTWRQGVRTVILGSADGRRFRELPITTDLKSDLPNAYDGGSVFWSAEEQLFVGYFRWWNENPRPHSRLLQDQGIITGAGVRSIFRSTSKDLRHWSPGVPMSFGDAPDEHLYESSTHPYFRAPHLYVALAKRFNPGRRSLTPEEEKALNIASLTSSSGRRFTFASDNNDLVLMTTKAGRTDYVRPFLEAFMRPGPNPANWTSRCNYAPQHGGLIPTAPYEMSFLVTRQHYQPANHIERMVLRTDGFASMRAPYAGGEFLTHPLLCPGGRLEVNFSTSGIGELQVEVQEDDGTPITGFTLKDCPPMIGDRIAGILRWTAGDSLQVLKGRSVRLRFRLTDADVYSFRFAEPGN